MRAMILRAVNWYAVIISAALVLSGLGVSQAAAGEPDAHGGHQELSAAGFSSESVYQLETHWIDETGADFPLAQLAPHPLVAAMIYTSCEYACPLIVGKMISAYHALDEHTRRHARFVLFSFDPTRDTPDKLNPYKKSQDIDQPEWRVLTSADDDAPLELAVALGVRYRPSADGEFAHSNIITVLDHQGVPSYQMVGLNHPVEEIVEAVVRASVGHR